MEIASFVISILAFAISIIPLFYTWFVERKKQTIEAYNDMQESLYCIYEYGEDEIEDFVTDSKSSEYKMISACMAQIEIFAIGIKTKTYDFDTAYSMSHGYLDGAIKRRIECILEKKTQYQPDSYENVIWLFQKMSKRSKKIEKKRKSK